MNNLTRILRVSCEVRSRWYCVRRTMSSATGGGIGDSTDRKRLLTELRQLDTAAICDADKILLSQSIDDGVADAKGGARKKYEGIRLLHSNMRPINGQHGESANSNHVMVGVARTVQCTKRNDFLAVLRGLMEAREGDVLMVDTSGSDRAVAGELFSLQAIQQGIRGIVVDGPVRDTSYVREIPTSAVRCYSTSVTPYSGSTQSPGNMEVSIVCGGVTVNPGDIVVGDNDGVIVADADTLEMLLPQAKSLSDAEAQMKPRLLNGESLASLTNCEEHIAARLAGEQSSLGFKV